MNYDDVVASATSGIQTPELVSAAYSIGEAKMALDIAQGTYGRNATGIALPVERRLMTADYTVYGEGRSFTGTFVADFVVGTDLCMIVEAPQGAQFSGDRLNRLVAA